MIEDLSSYHKSSNQRQKQRWAKLQLCSSLFLPQLAAWVAQPHLYSTSMPPPSPLINCARYNEWASILHSLRFCSVQERSIKHLRESCSHFLYGGEESPPYLLNSQPWESTQICCHFYNGSGIWSCFKYCSECSRFTCQCNNNELLRGW